MNPIAKDDPQLKAMLDLVDIGVAEVIVVDATGCEAFARLIFECGEIWLRDNGYKPRVRMHLVEVSEHGANSAIYRKD